MYLLKKWNAVTQIMLNLGAKMLICLSKLAHSTINAEKFCHSWLNRDFLWLFTPKAVNLINNNVLIALPVKWKTLKSERRSQLYSEFCKNIRCFTPFSQHLKTEGGERSFSGRGRLTLL